MKVGWYALQTRPQTELTCGDLLRQKEYNVFIPLAPTRRASKRRPKPLLPGYVFCRFDERSNGMMVRTPNVIRIVSVGRTPAMIDEYEIEALRTITESDVIRRPWKWWPSGCTVEIRTGPLRGLRGILLADQRKLIISVTILRRSVAVELDGETEVVALPGGDSRFCAKQP